jgi:hypothetical protein
MNHEEDSIAATWVSNERKSIWTDIELNLLTRVKPSPSPRE